MWLDHLRRHTRRYEQHIYQRCLASSTKVVAQVEHLHVDTVQGIFKR
ncbi:MAG: transposase family protein [Chloroflexota bacterium]|nr:transposase family protein [Chloroflexota bacterium]